MALATRCPNCQALFRVVADQLKLRGGLVRCGDCRHVFDAISMLSYIDDAAIAVPAPSNAPSAVPLPSALAAGGASATGTASTADGDVAAVDAAQATASDSAADESELEQAAEPEAQPGDDRVDDVEDRLQDEDAVARSGLGESEAAQLDEDTSETPSSPEDDASSGTTFGPTDTHAFDPAVEATVDTVDASDLNAAAQIGSGSTAAPVEQTEVDQDGEARGDPNSDGQAEPTIDEVTAAQTASVATGDASADDRAGGPAREHLEGAAAPYEWDAAALQTVLADEQAGAASDGPTAPEFLKQSERPRGFSIVFGSGVAVLTLLLALQLAVVFRSDILVRVPQALPLLTGACAMFHCNATWPARSDLLAVVGSELQAVPGTNVLELSTTVRNRAPHRQPLPAIEVTLTDTANRTVARKVFAPADYLVDAADAAARLSAGVDAGAEITIRIAFEAQGQNTTGYGFLVYPFHL